MNRLLPEINYLTPAGYRELKNELEQLRFKERPQVVNTVAWAAGNGDRSENGDYIYGKKRLREIDRRVAYLSQRLGNAEIIDPTKVSYKVVYFGAIVTLENEQGENRCYQVVGTDEVDVDQGKISWRSPLGGALLYRAVEDWVHYSSPAGVREVQIKAIAYPEATTS